MWSLDSGNHVRFYTLAELRSDLSVDEIKQKAIDLKPGQIAPLAIDAKGRQYGVRWNGSRMEVFVDNGEHVRSKAIGDGSVNELWPTADGKRFFAVHQRTGGIGITVYDQHQDYVLDSLVLGIPGFDNLPLDRISIDNHITDYDVQMDVWLFPFLNVQPIVHGLRDRRDIEVVLDLPSRIADRFRTGELDLAMVPSFEAATMKTSVLDSICIASDGPVETVLLHHRVPLREVRTLALDEASRTSAALSKILIAEASGHLPKTTMFSPHSGDTPATDAILVGSGTALTWTASTKAKWLLPSWSFRNDSLVCVPVATNEKP